jgi:hypothetical protein
MALETKCLTPGAQFHTDIVTDYEGREFITVSVDLPAGTLMNLAEADAELLEKLMHNQIELVLRPYFMRAKVAEVEYNIREPQSRKQDDTYTI